jgi:hypothetical protein
LVLVANRKRTVAVGVGVMEAVLVGKGVKVGVLVGGSAIAVWACAASAVCMITVSTEPGAGIEGGGVTSAGVAQPRMTNPRISHMVIRRTVRLFITSPRCCLALRVVSM